MHFNAMWPCFIAGGFLAMFSAILTRKYGGTDHRDAQVSPIRVRR